MEMIHRLMKCRLAAAAVMLTVIPAVAVARPIDNGLARAETQGKQLSFNWFWEDPPLIPLDGTNFQENLLKYDFLTVSFCAAWSFDCQDLKQTLDTAASVLKDDSKPIQLGWVDCTADINAKLCDSHGVTEYPTFKIFRKNRSSGPSEYMYYGIPHYGQNRTPATIITTLRAEAAGP